MNAGFFDVEQLENDSRNGGGWNTDLLNDSCYASVLERAKSALTTGSRSRFVYFCMFWNAEWSGAAFQRVSADVSRYTGVYP